MKHTNFKHLSSAKKQAINPFARRSKCLRLLVGEIALIDWARIQDLRLEIGDDDFFEVLAMFLEETDDVVNRLLEHPDLTAVEGLLHFLKGSALNLGLTDFAEICQNGEKAAGSGMAGSVDLQKLAAVYTFSKTALLASMGRPDAA